MGTQATIKVSLHAHQAAASPYSGGVPADVSWERVFGAGTTDYKYDELHQSSQSVAAASNEDVDLTALTDPYGTTLTAAGEVVLLVIEAAAANGGTLTFKASAANGWTNLFGTSADLKLKAGAKHIIASETDGNGWTVGATNKSYNVANSDGAAAGLYTLTILKRSA